MRALLLLLLATPALAQPACDAARLGTVSCQAGRMCECRFERGGSLTGLPDGYRWDCGALRPSCPSQELRPQGAWPPHMPPPQILLERQINPPRPRY